MEVNQKELARILNLTTRRIRQLKNEYGLFATSDSSDGKNRKVYKLEKCIPEYINFKIEAETSQGKAVVKEIEQAEHERVKKQISILKLRKLRRELHEARDVEEFLTNMLVDFKGRLIAIPQKVAPLVAAEDDLNRIMDTIEKEILEALEELSEYDPLKIDKEDTIVESIMSEDEDDEEDGE